MKITKQGIKDVLGLTILILLLCTLNNPSKDSTFQVDPENSQYHWNPI